MFLLQRQNLKWRGTACVCLSESGRAAVGWAWVWAWVRAFTYIGTKYVLHNKPLKYKADPTG